MKEITPKHLRCIPYSCPAVYEAGDKLIIIGKQAPDYVLDKIEGRIGEYEHAIIIDREYFADLKK